jgi:hypothetical protein
MGMKETDGVYHFNRCRRCNGLVTKLMILDAMQTRADVCPCGSGMFGPTNPVKWEWLLPRTLKMCVWQLMGWLAPSPEDGIVPPVPAGSFQPVAPLSAEEIRAPEEGEA